MKAPFSVILIGGALLAAMGCREEAVGRAGGGAAGRELLLLAAASTTNSVSELAAVFESDVGVKLKVVTGASNALANQIMAGVPGDVFLSANVRWAEAVQAAGLAQRSTPLLSNRLVIVVPRGNPASVASPADLRSEKVKRVALAGEKVPAGIYAEQALRWAGVYESLVAQNRVARGQDVRLALGYVGTGEAEAGVVYATDARVSEEVQVVYTFPDFAHDPIVYPVVLLNTSADRAAAARLYEFMFTPRAMAVFEKHGFSPAKGGIE